MSTWWPAFASAPLLLSARPRLAIANPPNQQRAGQTCPAPQIRPVYDDATKARQAAVAGAGAVRTLAAALKAHPSSASVQSAACHALRHLVRGQQSTITEAVTAGMLPLVVVAMKHHQADPEVQAACCSLVTGRSSPSILIPYYHPSSTLALP